MMLERLEKITRGLRPLMPFSAVLGVAGAGLFAWSAAVAEADDYLIPGLLAALWGAWLFTLVTGFRDVPPPASGQQSLRARSRVRLARIGFGVLAWILLAAGLAALFMTWRLLVVWLGCC